MNPIFLCFLVLGPSPLAIQQTSQAPPLDSRDLRLAFADKNDAEKKPAPRFTVGKDTTHVTGPLDKDGHIDYAAALNKQLGKGITPKNNANVHLWNTLGPKPEGAAMPAEYFQLLGIEPPPEGGDYFLGLYRFAKDRLQLKPGAQMQALQNESDRANQWPWTAKDAPNIAVWLKANETPLALAVGGVGISPVQRGSQWPGRGRALV